MSPFQVNAEFALPVGMCTRLELRREMQRTGKQFKGYPFLSDSSLPGGEEVCSVRREV